MLYVCDEPWQTEVLPVMVAGSKGVDITVRAIVLAAPEPHELFAITDILPPPEPAVTVIEFVAEVPVHPAGNVHV
jgi:hypothetical protein